MQKLIKFLAIQKYRFDLGMSFMSVLNFAMLVIAASPVLRTLIHVSVTVLVIASVPCALLLVWLKGRILEKLKFPDHYQQKQNVHNQWLKDIHDNESPRKDN